MKSGAVATILVPSSTDEQLHAEALLREAGIPFFAKNAEAQNLVGAGRIGGANLAIGAVAIQVPVECAREARDLLTGTLEDESFADSAPELRPSESGDEVESRARTDVAKYSKYSIVWSLLWLGGIGSLLAIYFGARALALSRAAPARAGERARALLGTTLGLAGLAVWFSVWGIHLLH